VLVMQPLEGVGGRQVWYEGHRWRVLLTRVSESGSDHV